MCRANQNVKSLNPNAEPFVPIPWPPEGWKEISENCSDCANMQAIERWFFRMPDGFDMRFRTHNNTTNNLLTNGLLTNGLLTSSFLHRGEAAPNSLFPNCSFIDEIRIFLGGTRNDRPGKRFSLYVLSRVSGVTFYNVELNAGWHCLFASVLCEDDFEKAIMWSSRMRCIDNEVFVCKAFDPISSRQILDGIKVPAGKDSGRPIIIARRRINDEYTQTRLKEIVSGVTTTVTTTPEQVTHSDSDSSIHTLSAGQKP